MARPTYPSDDVDKLLLRFPEGMRDQIKASAELLGRSMNAEIIQRLKRSLSEDQDDRVKLDLPGDLWNSLMTDAGISGVSIEERAIEILNGAYDPDSTASLDKVREMAEEVSEMQDLISHLAKQSDSDFLLYHGKITQLSQFIRFSLAVDGDNIEALRTAAKELEEANQLELSKVRRRHNDALFFQQRVEAQRKLQDEIDANQADDSTEVSIDLSQS